MAYDLIFKIALWTIAFISLYFAVLWVSVLYLIEPNFKIKKEPKKYPFVSIIIPCFNGAKTIRQTIRSVLASDYPKTKLEIIVVDDESTDNLASVVKRIKDRRVRLIKNKHEGYGNGSAINKGIWRAKGDIVAIIDDDGLVEKDALRILVARMNEDKLGSAVAGIKIYKPKNFIQNLQWFEYLIVSLNRRLLSAIDCLYVTPGALSLYKTKLLKKLGGFSSTSLTPDLEVAMHIQHEGYQIRSDTNAIAYTMGPRNWPELLKQRLRWYRGWFDVMWRYRDMLFNPKYSYLGMFYLPLSILIPSLLVVWIAIIAREMILRVYDTTSFIGIMREAFFQNWLIKETIVNISAVYFIIVILLILGIYVLWRAQVHYKERWHSPLTLVVYLTLYQFLLSAYWLVALVFHALGRRKVWHREGGSQ